MVGIVFIGDINMCPYLEKYIVQLDKNKELYEVIFWDRSYNEQKKYPADNIHVFKKKSKEQRFPLLKIKDFYLFGRFAKKIIRQRKYDKLIVLTTMTGMVLYRILINNYKNKFIFDYRDASYEYMPLFSYLINKLISSSVFSSISSEGFKDILPANLNYIIAHNFKYSDINRKKLKCSQYSADTPIQVSFIGVLRNTDYLKSMIDAFADDPRFVLNINGGGDNEDIIKEYAINYSNIYCTGRYFGEEKYEYINKADILCYNYPCSFLYNYALANKYYDGLLFKKPFLANASTYSGRLITEKGLGFSVDDFSKECLDDLYNYYVTFDRHQFVERAEQTFAEVLKQDEDYVQAINKFIIETK